MSTTQHTRPLSRDAIREIFVAHGFTVKEGQTDLKPYVYAAADALISAALASAPTQPDDQEREKFVNWLNGTYPRSHTKGEAEEHWQHGHISALAWKAGRDEMVSAKTQTGACQACGSECNERDELTKAAREIERLGEVVAKERASRQAAQIQVADLQARISRAGVEKRSAIYKAVKEALASAQAQPDTAMLDFISEHRVALIPEFEGSWDAEIYGEEAEAERICGGASPRDAIRAAMQLRAALSTQAAQPEQPVNLTPGERDVMAKALLRSVELQPEPSPTAGMTIAQRILHVGGRNNAAGYVEFGSTQAVEDPYETELVLAQALAPFVLAHDGKGVVDEQHIEALLAGQVH